MPITIAVDRSSAPVEVRDDMFGVNLIGGINEVDGLPNDGFVDAVELLGGTRLRYPAGKAASENITELDVSQSGFDQLRDDLRTYLDWVKETGHRTTLVLPSLTDEHADIANVQQWAELVLTYMGDQADLIVGYEIGNEYWAKINETDYGELAYDIARALDSVTVDGYQPEIWIQSANVLGGASDYKESSNGTISDSDAISALAHWQESERPDDWAEGQSAGDYYRSLGAFHKRVIKGELQLLESLDADRDITNGFQLDSVTSGIDGFIAHYYFDEEIDGFDLTPGSSRTEMKAFDLRFGVWQGLVSEDLTIQMTEWNVETNIWNWLGMRGAGAVIEQFHTMIELEVDGADIWAVRHNTSTAFAGSNNDERPVALTPSGVAFNLMHESLTGHGDPMYHLDLSGFDPTELEVNGFSNGYRSVIYVTSHSDNFGEEFSLDLSQIAAQASAWSGRIIGIDQATSDGLSNNAAYDENGDIASRLGRRTIDGDERDALISVLGAAYDSSLIKASGDDYTTYLPRPQDIYVLPGVGSPNSLDDFYFVTESDVKGSLTTVTQAQLGTDVSDLTFELDPYEVIEITIEHENVVYGADDSEILHGGQGVDELYGEGGDDYLRGYDGKDILVGGIGHDTLFGNDANDRLEGKAGHDRLYGGSGDDKLVGGDGDDYLRDESGKDDFLGGNGNDTVSYWGHKYGVRVNLLTGENSSADTYDSIENVYGSNIANDTISGDDSDNILYGAGGADRLYGNRGNDTLVGGDGDDYLRDSSGRDVFDGGAGSDTVSYYGHSLGVTANLLTGENSSADVYMNIEHLLGSNIASDTLIGDHGANRLDGAGGDDVLIGNNGADTLMGRDGDDSLSGDAGEDRLYGGAGDDTLRGGNGDDYLRDEAGLDVFDGGAGQDTVSYWGHSTGVTVNLQSGSNSSGDTYISIEHILGSNSADDHLTGDAQDNYIRGASGNDTLIGGAGNDTLRGDAGDDDMTGGSGADVFVFHDDFGQDTVFDFEGGASGDALDFTAVTEFTSFTDVLNNHAAQVGNDVVISLSSDHEITLQDVALADLTEQNFLF